MAYYQTPGFVRIIDRSTGEVKSLLPMYQLMLNPGKIQSFDRLDRKQFGAYCGCSEKNEYEILNCKQLFASDCRHGAECNRYRAKLYKHLDTGNFKAISLAQGFDTICVNFSWESKASQRYDAVIKRPLLKELHASALSLPAYVYLMQCLAYDAAMSKLLKQGIPAHKLRSEFGEVVLSYMGAIPIRNDKGSIFSFSENNRFSGSDELGTRFVYSRIKRFFLGNSDKYVYAVLDLDGDPVITLDKPKMDEVQATDISADFDLYVAGFVKTEEVTPFVKGNYSKITHSYSGGSAASFIRKKLLRSIFFNTDKAGMMIFPTEGIEQPHGGIRRSYNTFYPAMGIKDTGVVFQGTEGQIIASERSLHP